MQGLRQGEMKQLSDSYRERMRVAQMARNKLLMRQATYEYKMGMKKKGISTIIPLLNLLQVPILLTWFFSLRYMSNLPEVYPQMLSEGLLWFSDLSTYDPYFLLPVLAACGTSLSIARSPNLARNNISIPMLAPYMKYLKYMPFASLAFTGFFPASINLYWFVLAMFQLGTTQLMYTNLVRRKFGIKSD
jgi:YidC/Oxa1 family membrane protein insertase